MLLVSADFPPAVGGMQVYAWELARAFRALGADLTVIAPRQAGTAAHDREAGFEVRRIAHPGDSFAFSAALAVRRAVLEQAPDVILGTSWSCAAGSLRGLSLARAAVPVFAAAHGRELILRPFARVPLIQRAYDRLRKNALLRARAVFPVSQYAAGLVRALGVPDARIEVITNGVNPAQFSPRDAGPLRARLGLEGKRVLLTLGRMVERKGIDTVLAALPVLVKDVPNLAYVVVGDGPDRPRIARLVSESGVASHVHLVGRAAAEDLLGYYNLCDVFVMPARSDARDVEGFGLVFYEASACGRPVVGARAGGVTDAVVEGETGLLVPPDAPEQLADALRQLLLDPSAAAAMGARGRQHVLAHGTWEHAARRMYSAMLARRS